MVVFQTLIQPEPVKIEWAKPKSKIPNPCMKKHQKMLVLSHPIAPIAYTNVCSPLEIRQVNEAKANHIKS